MSNEKVKNFFNKQIYFYRSSVMLKDLHAYFVFVSVYTGSRQPLCVFIRVYREPSATLCLYPCIQGAVSHFVFVSVYTGSRQPLFDNRVQYSWDRFSDTSKVLFYFCIVILSFTLAYLSQFSAWQHFFFFFNKERQCFKIFIQIT
jgi:hypothetical protein